MGGTRASLVGLVALIALACTAAPARAESPADWLYEPTTFTEVHLTLPPESIKELEAEPKEYVEGTFSLAETNGTPGSAAGFTAPILVGIKLKGNLGSLRTVNQKAAFKIKFDEYVEDQRFLGLDKMTLNNMVQDPSMIHETVAYQAFHDMGVPAPHTGFTYLTVNGASYGLHLNIETQDQDSLEKQFGPFLSPPQHLYEGEYGADVTPSRSGELQVDEGKKKEKGDLEALVAAVGGTTPAFSQRVEKVVDLNEMTRDWLVEKYIGHWDGYSGSNSPNNYYLYSDASGKFQMLPSGTDQTWQSNRHLSFTNEGGVLFTDCIADPSCLERYKAIGAEALTKLNALGLDTVARCTAADLGPWQTLEDKTSVGEKRGPSPAAIAEEVTHTREFIASRPAELASFLGVAAPPKETGEPPCPPLRPIGGFPKPIAPVSPPKPVLPTTPPPTPTPATLRLGRFNASGKRIVVHLAVSGPGSVLATGTYRFDGKKRRACGGREQVGAAGAATVTCRLTAGFRKRLEDGSLRVALSASFIPTSGATASASRTLRLRHG